ncbi:AraC family transcriptional regulator [Noviherbaspirillum malthae]|uniref:AraC family transcriptional regulator n=1 Tax=Noviherbaspirillum malthae TaxID=1260987 RepID=UPI0018907288|nr:helix-turn-helix transcriptional regulator [Noviherbaspirillum malthae]
MNKRYLQDDISRAADEELNSLRSLPRPVYGHAQGLPNRAIGYRHSHAWDQLSYAMQGIIEVSTDTGRFVAPPSYAIWIPAGMPHGVQCSRDTEIRSLYIEPASIAAIASIALNADAEDDVGKEGKCRVLVVTPLMRELIRRFADIPVEYDVNGADGRLVAVLLDQLACAPEAGMYLPWPQDARLRKVCTYLQARPESQKNLADFGNEFGMSERTLIRLFLQQTGLSFRLWRQRARLLSALPLLEQGQRVTDVALACGYDSMSAFIAAFRDQMGVTPGEFAMSRT